MSMTITTGSQKGLPKTSIRERPRPPVNPGGKGPPHGQGPPRNGSQQFSGQQILEITDEQIEFIKEKKPAVDIYINNIRKPEFSGSLSDIDKTDKKIVVQLSGSKQPGKEKETKIMVTKSIMIEFSVLPNKEVEI